MGISFRVLDEVEKQVVLVDAYAAGGGGAMDVDGQGQQGADEGTVIKTIRKTEVVVLCSQHNPVRGHFLSYLPFSDLSFYSYNLIPDRRRLEKGRQADTHPRPATRAPAPLAHQAARVLGRV